MHTIEFFHNVTCGHCFIMSRRLKEVIKHLPDVRIIHRSFPFHLEREEIDSNELVRKWEIANRIDEAKRFNVDKLKATSFKMPASLSAQRAIRAATLLGEDAWTWFDRFQKALFEDVLDISDETIIFEIIRQSNINFDAWYQWYQHPKSLTLEQADFKRVSNYQLQVIPALVVNERFKIEGTKRTDLALQLIQQAIAETP